MNYIYESPDKGYTIYRRLPGEVNRQLIYDYQELETLASQLEITVDYYIHEFIWWSKLPLHYLKNYR